ncbi:MAG: PilZ domain-containing protein [Proteobacteria bacterium]|nr:PilZ domain-containing protein [Pseudomonadota bacterium]
MEEKRHIKRKHLVYYLRVFDTQNDKAIGRMLDITNKGMMIFGEDRLPLNKVYSLKLVLPDTIGGKEVITFEAESLRCEKDVNPDFYNTGFKIISIVEDDILTIQRLIERFGFND